MFNFDLNQFLANLVLRLPWILLGFAFHEYCHAWMSVRLGDPLPERQGRLTLNPIKHIEPFGLIALIITQFGWAKPVQINPRFYRNPIRDTMWVSLAGPVGIFILAFVLAILIRLMGFIHLDFYNYGYYLFLCFYFGIFTMLSLGLFNLIPIPPLDGSKILRYFLRGSIGYRFDRLEPYGFMVIIVLVFLGGFTGFLSRVVESMSLLLSGISL